MKKYVIEVYNTYHDHNFFEGYFVGFYNVNNERYVSFEKENKNIIRKYKSKKRAQTTCDKLHFNNNSLYKYKVVEYMEEIK